MDIGRRAGHHSHAPGDEQVGGAALVQQGSAVIHGLPCGQEGFQRAAVHAVQSGGNAVRTVAVVHKVAAQLTQPVGQGGAVGDGLQNLLRVSGGGQVGVQGGDVGKGVGSLVPPGGGEKIGIIVGDGGGGGEGQTQLDSGELPVGQGSGQVILQKTGLGVGCQSILGGEGLAGVHIGHLAGGIHLHHIGKLAVVFGRQQGFQQCGGIGILPLIDALDGDAVGIGGVEFGDVFVHQHAGLVGGTVPEGEVHRRRAKDRLRGSGLGGFGCSGLGRDGLRRGCAAAAGKQQGQNEDQGKQLFHGFYLLKFGASR